MYCDLLIPTHLKEIHAYDAHRAGILGQGIGIAVLDTGIYPHPDFFIHGCRIAAFCDFVSGLPHPYDDADHGTHICGIIASGQKDRLGRYMGIAPFSHMICGKILNSGGNGSVSSALGAFRWILSHQALYNIRIVNISVGMPVKDPEDEFSPLIRSVNALWDAGLVVIAAAGNNGPREKTITSPGISRKIITVGSCESTEFFSSSPDPQTSESADFSLPGSRNIPGSSASSSLFKSHKMQKTG